MRLIITFLFAIYISTDLSLSQTDTLFNQTDNKGLKQGYWKKYYPNGNLLYKGYFENNMPSGEMKRYYESGAIQAVMFFSENGKRSKIRLFYEDGELSAEGSL